MRVPLLSGSTLCGSIRGGEALLSGSCRPSYDCCAFCRSKVFMAAAAQIAWNVVSSFEKTLWSRLSSWWPRKRLRLAHSVGLRKGKNVYTSSSVHEKFGGSWWSLKLPPRHQWSMSAWQWRCCRKRFIRSEPARSSSEPLPRTLLWALDAAGSSRMRKALASSVASSRHSEAHCSMRSDCRLRSLEACTSVTRFEMRLHRYEPSSAMCTGFSECVQKTCTSCSLPWSTAHMKRSHAAVWLASSIIACSGGAIEPRKGPTTVW
eukprot:1811280-Prymnesium_polylepis.1